MSEDKSETLDQCIVCHEALIIKPDGTREHVNSFANHTPRWIAPLPSSEGTTKSEPTKKEIMTTEEKLDKAINLLDRATSLFESHAPDTNWFREYFLLTEQHAFLTDEGWELGENKQAYLNEDPTWRPDDEVNAPVLVKEQQ